MLLSAEDVPQNPFSSYSARAHRYAADVLTGKRLAGKWVRRAALRFFKDLDRAAAGWTYCYDEEAANATCALFELFIHDKGEFGDQQVRLGDWQCFLFCNIFGWLIRSTGYRRFTEAFILIPKGNGKTPMGAWVALKLGFFDGEKGAEVYCAATSAEQAFEVYKVAKYIVEHVSALTKRFGIVAGPTTLYQRRTNSRVKVISGKYKDGKAPSGVINDEYHQQQDDTLRDSLKNAMDKRPQTLMFEISTAGDTIEGPCYQKQQDVQDILRNVEHANEGYANERQYAIIYDVDEGVDWNTREACVMANPNFGVSLDEEKTLASLAEAVRNSAKQNGFRTKRQNYWVGQLAGWMNMESWRLCQKPGLREEDFGQYPCYLGSDMASTLDLAATVKVFVRYREDGKPIYTCFARAYLPERRVNDPTRKNLQGWHKDGFLTATPGSSIDYGQIENDTVADIETFKVRELAYDKRYADQYSQQVANRTGVIRTEIAPNPEQISPAMKELEGAVEDGRFEHDGHPVLAWCMGNLLARANQATGNYHMPSKDRPEKKIDVAMALLIAMARARFCLSQDDFIDPEVFTV